MARRDRSGIAVGIGREGVGDGPPAAAQEDRRRFPSMKVMSCGRACPSTSASISTTASSVAGATS